MLEIQKFILSHDNWKELLTASPYNLTIKEDGSFVLFKYSQLNSDFSKQICREARGLILDSSNSYEVVRMAFSKFFNIQEVYADEIDWSNCYANEKIDGSIISVWNASDSWHISTNSVINAYDAPVGDGNVYKNFSDLFSAAIDLNFSTLKRNLIYTFELVSPVNRQVIVYPEPKVYLIGVRDKYTLEELDIYDDFTGLSQIERPQIYKVHSREEALALVESMGKDHEGIVVRDKNWNRVKIKTESYFKMHKLNNNGNLTLERVIDLILKNDHYEFLSYFPFHQDYFNKVEEVLYNAALLMAQIDCFVQDWKNHFYDKKRKEFAALVNKTDTPWLYFARYDGKLVNGIRDIPINKIITTFKIREKMEGNYGR